jgi:Icc-related predicted phosphoesterase
VAQRTRLYFATDLHGSEKCFRKFLNGARAYKADVLVLGGDIGGKAIQTIVDQGDGTFTCNFRGKDYALMDDDELRALEQLISDYGYYPHRMGPGELEARVQDGSIDDLLIQLMTARLERWLTLAEERLRQPDLDIFWMLGNDDPPQLATLFDEAPWGHQAEDKIWQLDDQGHQLASFGYSNLTPWDSYREMPEVDLLAHLSQLCNKLDDPEQAIFNFHVPPYGTGLDEAPVLDSDLRVQTAVGQVKMAAVGSTAVKETIERFQPLASLHGHVHESAGFRRIGRTIALNPGSDYGTGALNGVLITLEKQKVKAHQFVRG